MVSVLSQWQDFLHSRGSILSRGVRFIEREAWSAEDNGDEAEDGATLPITAEHDALLAR